MVRHACPERSRRAHHEITGCFGSFARGSGIRIFELKRETCSPLPDLQKGDGLDVIGVGEEIDLTYRLHFIFILKLLEIARKG